MERYILNGSFSYQNGLFKLDLRANFSGILLNFSKLAWYDPKTQKRFSWFVFVIFIMGGAWSHADAYDYPLKDPYLATVIGTPSEFQPKMPEKIDYKMLSFKVFC